MIHLLTLLRHELRSLFVAPATYVAAFLFFLLMGWSYLAIIRAFTLNPQDAAPAEVYFFVFPFTVLFLVPLLTMRSLAEERRLATLETLMTTPVTATAVVLSKFLASWLFYCLLWILTLTFPLLALIFLNRPDLAPLLLDRGILTGGYLFIFLSGMLYTSVGIFSSSLTRSQLVSGMLAFSILFMLMFGFYYLAEQAVALNLWAEAPLEYLRIFDHLEDFSRGIIDSRPLVFYASNTLLVLGLAVLVVEAKT